MGGGNRQQRNISLGAEGEPVEVPEQSFSIWINDSPREVSLKVARKVASEEGDTARLHDADRAAAPTSTVRFGSGATPASGCDSPVYPDTKRRSASLRAVEGQVNAG